MTNKETSNQMHKQKELLFTIKMSQTQYTIHILIIMGELLELIIEGKSIAYNLWGDARTPGWGPKKIVRLYVNRQLPGHDVQNYGKHGFPSLFRDGALNLKSILLIKDALVFDER